MLEVTFDQGGMGLSDSEVRTDIADKFLLVERPGSADRVGFDILVEILVWIDLGAVTRQKVNTNSGLVLFEPVLRSFRKVNGMSVEDQKIFRRF